MFKKNSPKTDIQCRKQSLQPPPSASVPHSFAAGPPTDQLLPVPTFGLRSPQFRCEAAKWRYKAALQSKNAPAARVIRRFYLNLQPQRIRETGENPVQSRCCKFHCCRSLLATGGCPAQPAGRRTAQEQARKPAAAQAHGTPAPECPEEGLRETQPLQATLFFLSTTHEAPSAPPRVPQPGCLYVVVGLSHLGAHLPTRLSGHG